MSIANKHSYLNEMTDILGRHYPDNRTVNIVCHGHSVPAGYFATPMVDTFNAYPHLLHVGLREHFPFAVINIIVTAIGGDNSQSGAARFLDEVLCHRPDVITIDYGLNDRGIGLEQAHAGWSRMIKAGLKSGAKIILLTPTVDRTQAPTYTGDDKSALGDHANQIRLLADQYGVGLVDSFAMGKEHVAQNDLSDLLSPSDHPTRAGHELVARDLLRWFSAR